MDRREQMKKAYGLGWGLIPLKKNSKEPNLPIGHPYLTRKPEYDEYKQFKFNNYGIVTGAVSGLCVLDIDGPEGMHSLDTHDHMDVVDIATPRVFTPNGMHIYFQHNPGVKTRVGILKGIDVRSTGAYVVGPGSMVDGKAYVWDEVFDLDTPLSPVPGWLLEQPSKETRLEAWKIGETIEDGKRNKTLISLAGTLVIRDVPSAVVLEMLRTMNTMMCKPPLEDEEIIKITSSAERYRNQ